MQSSPPCSRHNTESDFIEILLRNPVPVDELDWQTPVGLRTADDLSSVVTLRDWHRDLLLLHANQQPLPPIVMIKNLKLSQQAVLISAWRETSKRDIDLVDMHGQGFASMIDSVSVTPLLDLLRGENFTKNRSISKEVLTTIIHNELAWIRWQLISLLRPFQTPPIFNNKKTKVTPENNIIYIGYSCFPSWLSVKSELLQAFSTQQLPTFSNIAPQCATHDEVHHAIRESADKHPTLLVGSGHGLCASFPGSPGNDEILSVWKNDNLSNVIIHLLACNTGLSYCRDAVPMGLGRYLVCGNLEPYAAKAFFGYPIVLNTGDPTIDSIVASIDSEIDIALLTGLSYRDAMRRFILRLESRIGDFVQRFNSHSLSGYRLSAAMLDQLKTLTLYLAPGVAFDDAPFSAS